jgi:iron complex transport system ATP-binding protein
MKPFDLKNISYQIAGSRLLDDISISSDKSEFLGVIGPNGAGKSTLLRLLNVTIKPTKGKWEILGRDPRNLSLKDMYRLRRKIATVPQIVEFNSSIPLTVREVVEMARIGRNPPGKTLSAEDISKLDESMDSLGLHNLRNRTYRSLSGGERQKVQLARVLAQEPEILLLDEPTSSLDMEWQERLVNLIQEIYYRHRFMIIMTTHLTGHLPSCCERIILLKQGRILFDGSAVQALTREKLEELYHCRVDIFDYSGRKHCFGIGAIE